MPHVQGLLRFKGGIFNTETPSVIRPAPKKSQKNEDSINGNENDYERGQEEYRPLERVECGPGIGGTGQRYKERETHGRGNRHYPEIVLHENRRQQCRGAKKGRGESGLFFTVPDAKGLFIR